MGPLTTLSELQSRLGWQNITEDRTMSGWRVFAVWPSQKVLPTIEFVFDGDVSMLQQLGFGPWHGHYQNSSNERRNVLRAIATARTLVAGTRCLLVEQMSGGKYLGSGIYRRGKLPLTLSDDFGQLERLTFGQPPEHVAIDLTRFHKTKRGSYIEHGWRQHLKSAYSGTTVNTAMFD